MRKIYKKIMNIIALVCIFMYNDNAFDFVVIIFGR